MYSSSQTWGKHSNTCAYKHLSAYFELFEVLSSICCLEAFVPMFKHFMKIACNGVAGKVVMLFCCNNTINI